MLELAMLLSLELGSGDNQNKPQQKHYCRQHKYCMNVVRDFARLQNTVQWTLEIPKRKLLLFLPFLCIRTNLVLPDFTLKYLLNGPFYGDFVVVVQHKHSNHCNRLRPATLQWCVNICNAIHQNREDSSFAHRTYVPKFKIISNNEMLLCMFVVLTIK